MELSQKNIFASYHLSFHDIELKYKKSSLLHYTQQIIPIDNISMRSYNVTRKVDLVALVIAGCIFIGFVTGITMLSEGINNKDIGELIGSVIAFIVTLVGLIYWINLISIRVYITTTTGVIIDFLHNKPNHQQVDQFIDQLKATQKKFFIDRYGNVDKSLPINDQLQNLVWLRNNSLLNNEEFEAKKNYLIGKNPEEKRIGFNKD